MSPAVSPSVPRHLAVIMDGNGRWAERRRRPRVIGHRAGARAVNTCIDFCLERGIGALTLFAFSSENWGRPEEEVGALMKVYEYSLTPAWHTVSQRLAFKRQRGTSFSLVHLLVKHRILIHGGDNHHGAGGHHAAQEEHWNEQHMGNLPPGGVCLASCRHQGGVAHGISRYMKWRWAIVGCQRGTRKAAFSDTCETSSPIDRMSK